MVFMKRKKFFYKKTMLSTLLIIGCLVSKTIGSKKYDVEAESLKLYGEDLRDALAKFRRTPDYLKILDSKVQLMRTRLGDIMIQTHLHFDQKLKEKVGDLLGIQKSDLDKKATTQAITKENTPAFFRTNSVRFRRQEEGTEATKTDSKETESQEQRRRVKILDSYHKLTSALTLAQRNSMKDLGFEYAGHLIHSLIRTMGANDVEVKSTRHPFGGDVADKRTSPTTHHVNVHEVTTLPSKTFVPTIMSTVQGPVTKVGEFMFKYGRDMLP